MAPRQRYPLPTAVKPAEHPEHNPTVAAPCSKCNGRGKWSEYHGLVHQLHGCKACDGTGFDIFTPSQLFKNDAPPLHAQLDEHGWVTCPGCSRRFATYDEAIWTGLRHVKCGQRMLLSNPPG